MRQNLHLVSAVIMLTFMCGCSSSVSLNVTDAGSGAPVVGIRVERYRPASGMVKVFNPIRATYFPMDLAETKSTDPTGTVTFGDTGPKDHFQFYTRGSQALVVSLRGMTARLSPDTNQVAKAGWGYSVWIENGTIQQSSWPQKEKESDVRQ